MNVTYSQRAQQSQEARALLEQATALLEEILEQSAGVVKTEWDRNEDEKGRSLFTLRISDSTGSVSTVFDLQELASPKRMRVRLYRLWGQLLQTRVDKQLQELTRGEG